MKKLHQFIHAYDTARHYNGVVATADVCYVLLKNQNMQGAELGLTLEELKTAISTNCTDMKDKYKKMDTFLVGFDSYDLTKYTDKAQYNITQDKIKMDAFANGLANAIKAPQVQTLSKLADIADTAVSTNPIMYAAPITLVTPYHYAIMINDWLDASDYTLRGIHQGTGKQIILTDEQKKVQVRGYLNQIESRLIIQYPIELQDDVDSMVSVRDWVLLHLDDTPLLDVADYISSNVVKLPLFRRIWAV